MVLVEARGIREHLFIDIEQEALTIFVNGKHLPRNGKELIADTEKTTESKDSISDAARGNIDHYFRERAKVIAVAVADSVLG
jgi:hypothetical protein